VQGIVARYPSFAPAWRELVAFLADDDARLHAIRGPGQSAMTGKCRAGDAARDRWT
jgi:hypothetical protein